MWLIKSFAVQDDIMEAQNCQYHIDALSSRGMKPCKQFHMGIYTNKIWDKNMIMKNQSDVTGIELSPLLRVINQASMLLLWFVAAEAPVQSAGPPVPISLISSSVPRTLIVRTFGFDWFLQMAPLLDYALLERYINMFWYEIPS